MVTKRAKKKRLTRFAIISCVLLLALAATAYVAFDTGLSVTKFSIISEKLPAEFDGFKIVQLTDLHCAYFGEKQQELSEIIDSLSPDLVVFTGDMIDENILDFDCVEELCAVLSAKYPILSVWGNHDRWLAKTDFKKMVDIYEKYGVETLCGNNITLERNGAQVIISGADDPASWGSKDLNFVMENGIGVSPTENEYNILLYHRANIFPCLSTLGYDLVLAGHMHGGQIRIPFAGGLVSPTGDYFPDYTAGKYQKNGTTMIVGRGLGNAVDVPRIFNPPEVVLITLRRK